MPHSRDEIEQLRTVCRAWQSVPAIEWPAQRLTQLAELGLFRWFVPSHVGGAGWSDLDLFTVYHEIARNCLTTAFILTQRQGAVGRIAACENERLRQTYLPRLLSGESFATVGISHLTTSGRHLSTPLMAAEPCEQGFRLQGFMPWVTGAQHAEMIVAGATLCDGRELLALLETSSLGVSCLEPVELVALSASRTGRVDCEQVVLPRESLLYTPRPDIMKSGPGAGTGGWATSALALGLSSAAIEYMADEARRRPELKSVVEAFTRETNALEHELKRFVEDPSGCSPHDLRLQCNLLALRVTQAALGAAKGAGFAASHCVGRWCREALFFIVWSCPQGVAQSQMCRWAGIE